MSDEFVLHDDVANLARLEVSKDQITIVTPDDYGPMSWPDVARLRDWLSLQLQRAGQETA